MSSDVERLFRQIVLNLNTTEPARLYQPISLADVRDSIVPYRANRRTLALETSEDYEVALLRLCAGEEGLVRTEPPAAQAEFAAELTSPNPDLAILQRQEKAELSLDPDALAKFTNPDPDRAFAPREPARDSGAKARKPKKRGSGPIAVEPATSPHCPRCRQALPTGRVVNFCPQCGQNLTRRYCPQCNTELEPGWKHCVSCGHALKQRPESGA